MVVNPLIHSFYFRIVHSKSSMLGIPPLSPIDGNPSIYHVIYSTRLERRALGAVLPRFDVYDTLWLFNIAMENGPFIVDLPIKNGDFQ